MLVEIVQYSFDHIDCLDELAVGIQEFGMSILELELWVISSVWLGQYRPNPLFALLVARVPQGVDLMSTLPERLIQFKYNTRIYQSTLKNTHLETPGLTCPKAPTRGG